MAVVAVERKNGVFTVCSNAKWASRHLGATRILRAIERTQIERRKAAVGFEIDTTDFRVHCKAGASIPAQESTANARKTQKRQFIVS